MASGTVPARLPDRNSFRAFLQGLQQRVPLQRSRQGFQHHSLSKGSSSLIACHNLKNKEQKKAQRRCRSCFHIGANEVAELFQESSSQTSNITTRHIRQSKKQYKQENNVHICSGSSQRFQQQDSSKVPGLFRFFGVCIFLSPLPGPSD